MKAYSTTKKIGVTPSGLDLSIDILSIDSEKIGPKIYIQGGMHGGEIVHWIIKDLYNYFISKPFRGTITFVPISNPVSWLQRQYFSTNGKFDQYMGKDWNRNFPGKNDGSLGSRIANSLFELASSHDFCIDLHTSRNSVPFGIYFSEKLAKKYVSSTNIELNLITSIKDNPNYRSTLSGALTAIKTENITFECGNHDEYNKKNNTIIYNAILSVLKKLGTIDSLDKKNGNVRTFSKTTKIYSPNGGFIKYKFNPGDKFKKDDVLFELEHSTKLKKKPEVVKAPFNGIILKQSPTHIFWPGDEVYEIINSSDLKSIQ